MNTPSDMSGRVNVVLPDEVYELIKKLAETERRSQSQMTAFLIEEALMARGIFPKNETAAIENESSEPPTPDKTKTKGGKTDQGARYGYRKACGRSKVNSEMNMRDYWEKNALAFVKRVFHQKRTFDHSYEAMLPYGKFSQKLNAHVHFNSAFEVIEFCHPKRFKRRVTIDCYAPLKKPVTVIFQHKDQCSRFLDGKLQWLLRGGSSDIARLIGLLVFNLSSLY